MMVTIDGAPYDFSNAVIFAPFDPGEGCRSSSRNYSTEVCFVGDVPDPTFDEDYLRAVQAFADVVYDRKTSGRAKQVPAGEIVRYHVSSGPRIPKRKRSLTVES